jgi:phenylacetate-CoA ligase
MMRVPRVDEAALRPATVQSLLDQGVSRAVDWALDHSPWNRERLLAAGVAPGSVRCVADLCHLPTTSKQDLAAAGRSLWAVPREQVVDISTTSGTSGEPTLCPMTEADLQRLAENERLSFTCAGLGPADTALVAVTIDRCFMAGLAYFIGLRALGASVARVGAGSPALLVEMVRRLEPSTIVGVPSFLERCAQWAEGEGIALVDSSVTRLVCIGEPVRGPDLEPTPMAQRAAEAWGARLYGSYGISELAASTCECGQGAGGHLHPSLLHVEVLDEQDRPVAPGALGEVVATPLGVEALPLLRYRTGDIAALLPEPCGCGLHTPRLGPIVGRKHHALKLKGTTVYPAAVQRVLDREPALLGYVLVARSDGALSDRLEIVLAHRADTSELLQRLRRRLQGALKVTPTITVVQPGEIEALQQGGVGRKKRVFIDER